MAMNLMFAFAALIHKRKLEQGPNIGAFASQCNEDGDVSGTIFGVFTVGVKVNSPPVATYSEIIADNVLPNAHPFG